MVSAQWSNEERLRVIGALAQLLRRQPWAAASLGQRIDWVAMQPAAFLEANRLDVLMGMPGEDAAGVQPQMARLE